VLRAMSGHRINSVYDQRRAIEKAQEFQRGEMEKLKVVSIRE
jgi:hypothetical protein